MTIVQKIVSSSLGSILDGSEAESLAQHADHVNLDQGRTLFTIGDESQSMFLILEGSLEVVLGTAKTGTSVVATLGPGQVVGELEMMTKARRVATLVATSPCELLEISKQTFDGLVEAREPMAIKLLTHIAKSLARRLSSVNQRIVSKLPKPPADEAPAPETVEVADDDIMLVHDEDLDVLDKLWS